MRKGGSMKQVLTHTATGEFYKLLGRHIERLRVSWQINPEGYIMGFCRFGGKPGNGAKAMRHICALADVWGMDLSLHVANDRLLAYYAQFGFVRDEDTQRMYRKVQPFGCTAAVNARDTRHWLMIGYKCADYYMLAHHRRYREERAVS